MLGRRVLGVALVLTLANTALSEDVSFDLLEIDRRIAKWGEPQFGSGVVVTYSYARDSHEFPQARNCKKIAPLSKLLSSTGFDEQSFKKQTQLAFAAWSRVANIKFKEAPRGTKPDILIGAQGRPREKAFANVSLSDDPTLASAGRQAGRPLHPITNVRASHRSPEKLKVSSINQALICLNPLHNWKLGRNGDSKSYELKYTLTHEIGHAIGLDHAGARGQLMSFSYQENLVGLQPGDIAGIQKLYGVPRSSLRQW